MLSAMLMHTLGTMQLVDPFMFWLSGRVDCIGNTPTLSIIRDPCLLCFVFNGRESDGGLLHS